MTIANYLRNNLVENDLEFGDIILNNALLQRAAKDYQDLLIGLEENELKGSKFFALIERAFPFLREEYEAANKKIDFNKNARDIFNFVRGLSPFPGTYMQLDDGRKFKVYDVEYVQDSNINSEIHPGDILLMSKNELYIRCKDGYISIKTIQPENSKRMDVKAFMAGNRLNMLDKFI